jgi:putative holliday junction resolvase
MTCGNANTDELKKSILAIDVGTVRIGLAKSILGVVTPIAIVDRAQGRGEKKIIEVIAVEKVELIVVGLPLSDDGSENEQCVDIRKFSARLAKRTSVAMVFHDEYLSSFEAEAIFSDLQHRSQRKRGTKRTSFQNDAFAAALILRGFLGQHFE